MTDILTQTATELRAMAAIGPGRFAEVRAAYETPGIHGRMYLLGRGIPYPVLSALPAETVDVLATAFRDYAPDHERPTA